MKIVAFLSCLAFLALGVGGCSSISAEKQEIVETVIDVVGIRALREVEVALIAEGVATPEARKVAAIAVARIEELVRKALRLPPRPLAAPPAAPPAPPAPPGAPPKPPGATDPFGNPR